LPRKTLILKLGSGELRGYDIGFALIPLRPLLPLAEGEGGSLFLEGLPPYPPFSPLPEIDPSR
jgi:hypothetical protein